MNTSNLSFLNLNRGNRSVGIQILLYTAYIIAVSLYTSKLTFNYEDWIHFSDFSFEEAKQMFLSSYNKTNARLGEAGSYFIGPYALEIFHAVQPLFVLACCLACSRLSTGQWIGCTTGSLVATLLLMIGIPATHAGIWWFDGNLSWFYPVTIALLFFALYDNIFQGDFKLPAGRFILMLPMAYAIGMSNENTSVTALAVYLACGLYWGAIRKRRLSVPYIILGVIIALGAYFLYTAPGPQIRATKIMGWELNLETLIYRSLLSKGNWVYLLICYWRLLIPAAFLLALCRWRHIRIMSTRTWILLGAFCFAQGVLVAAPCWGAPRSYILPQMLFLVILAEILCRSVNTSLPRRDTLIWLSLFFACAATLISSQIIKACTQQKIYCQIEDLAKAAKCAGSQHLIMNTKQLDLNPICGQIPGIPRFVMHTDIEPEIPLLTLRSERLATTDTSVQGDFPYGIRETPVNYGRRALNIPMARRVGLQSIICIDDRKPQDE